MAVGLCLIAFPFVGGFIVALFKGAKDAFAKPTRGLPDQKQLKQKDMLIPGSQSANARQTRHPKTAEEPQDAQVLEG